MNTDKIKVLLIDDDDVDRLMLMRALKLSGFNAEILTATDIDGGKQLAAETKFDCIFLDYNLPGSNGIEFLEYFNSRGINIPVVMVTSKGDENLAVEAMKKGAADYLPKNMITAESIISVLQNVFKKNTNEVLAPQSCSNSPNIQNETSLQIELAAVNKMLNEKEQLLTSMAHECKKSVNSIHCLADNLLKSVHSSSELQAIKNSAACLLAIINDIADQELVESGKIKFESSEFNLLNLVNALGELLKPAAEEKNIEFNLLIDQSVPKVLIGDAGRLCQALNNLVRNAIALSEKGNVKVEIIVLEKNENFHLIQFKVADTGNGISQQRLSTIFDSFAYVSDDNLPAIHTGAYHGLNICKKIIEQQGGMISAKSKVNEGSEFTFSLSFKTPKSEPQSGHKFNQCQEETTSGKKVKLLIVEDSEINRLVITTMMKEWGFEIECAPDGASAAIMIDQNNYDVVLMDIEMPEMNGYQATEHIRKNISAPKNQVPVLALTAHASDEEKEKCLNSGMTDYLSKPYDAEELKAKIIALAHTSAKNKTINTSNKLQLTSEAKCTNLSYLREISENNESFFRDFISLFLQNAPQSITDMEIALSKNDWEGVRQAAHKLKPSLSYLGMKDIHKAAATAEEFAKKQTNLEEIPELISKIKETCTKAYTELEFELKELNFQ